MIVEQNVDDFEFFREAPPLLAWDVSDGVADEMHDAALHDHLREARSTVRGKGKGCSVASGTDCIRRAHAEHPAAVNEPVQSLEQTLKGLQLLKVTV